MDENLFIIIRLDLQLNSNRKPLNQIEIFCFFISKEFEIYTVPNSIESGHLSGYRSVGIYGRYQCYCSEGNLSLDFFFVIDIYDVNFSSLT